MLRQGTATPLALVAASLGRVGMQPCCVTAPKTMISLAARSLVVSHRAFSAAPASPLLAALAGLSAAQLAAMQPAQHVALARLARLPEAEKKLLPAAFFNNLAKSASSGSLARFSTADLADVALSLRGAVQGDGQAALTTLEAELSRRDLSELSGETMERVVDAVFSAVQAPIMRSVVRELQRRGAASAAPKADAPATASLHAAAEAATLHSVSSSAIAAAAIPASARSVEAASAGTAAAAAAAAPSAAQQAAVQSIDDIIVQAAAAAVAAAASGGAPLVSVRNELFDAVLQKGGVRLPAAVAATAAAAPAANDAGAVATVARGGSKAGSGSGGDGGSSWRQYARRGAASAAAVGAVLTAGAVLGSMAGSAPRPPGRMVAALENCQPQNIITLLRYSIVDAGVEDARAHTLVASACSALVRTGLGKYTASQLVALAELVPTGDADKTLVPRRFWEMIRTEVDSRGVGVFSPRQLVTLAYSLQRASGPSGPEKAKVRDTTTALLSAMTPDAVRQLSHDPELLQRYAFVASSTGVFDAPLLDALGDALLACRLSDERFDVVTGADTLYTSALWDMLLLFDKAAHWPAAATENIRLSLEKRSAADLRTVGTKALASMVAQRAMALGSAPDASRKTGVWAVLSKEYASRLCAALSERRLAELDDRRLCLLVWVAASQPDLPAASKLLSQAVDALSSRGLRAAAHPLQLVQLVEASCTSAVKGSAQQASLLQLLHTALRHTSNAAAGDKQLQYLDFGGTLRLWTALLQLDEQLRGIGSESAAPTPVSLAWSSEELLSLRTQLSLLSTRLSERVLQNMPPPHILTSRQRTRLRYCVEASRQLVAAPDSSSAADDGSAAAADTDARSLKTVHTLAALSAALATPVRGTHSAAAAASHTAQKAQPAQLHVNGTAASSTHRINSSSSSASPQRVNGSAHGSVNGSVSGAVNGTVAPSTTVERSASPSSSRSMRVTLPLQLATAQS